MKHKATRLAVLWGITALALYYAFYAVDWHKLVSHIRNANGKFIALALFSTVLSYIFRSRRWQFLFSCVSAISFPNALRVLFLGFFMNNIIPARAGELVRAHIGSKVTNLSRTLVLATIASERLCDGLTISIMFVLFTLGIKSSNFPIELMYVASVFGMVTLFVAFTLLFRNKIFFLIEAINRRFTHKAADYMLARVKIFIDGLSPLFKPERTVIIVLWSTLIWLIELSAYVFIGAAFRVSMPLQYFVLFLVAVNFSSLIPAAPGGIGVIEAISKAVLITVGVDPELALAMVICQHAIQYIVVGIPGLFLMFSWKEKVKEAQEAV
ncbi:MAG: UPF0104 family protein [Candidatus Dadabacteria bacterium]|nr:MAG: UPF0104 family protein [Candidatus Dadabacteria bacterium]